MSKKDSNELGEALRLFRVFHDLSVNEMARLLDVTAGYVSSIECGRKTPNIVLIKKYAQIFETTPSAIIFFSEDLSTGRLPKGVRSVLRSGIVKFMRAIENAGKEAP